MDLQPLQDAETKPDEVPTTERQNPQLTLLEALRAGPQFDLNIPPRGRLKLRKPIDF